MILDHAVAVPAAGPRMLVAAELEQGPEVSAQLVKELGRLLEAP